MFYKFQFVSTLFLSYKNNLILFHIPQQIADNYRHPLCKSAEYEPITELYHCRSDYQGQGINNQVTCIAGKILTYV